MNIQQEELERLDLEGTDIQDAEATIEMVAEESSAQAPEVPVMEVPEVPSVQVPEEPDQELVVAPPIPVVEEPSTQEAEEVEMLDIENDESLAVEDSTPMSKTKKVLNYLKSSKKRAVLKRAFHVWQLKPHEVAPLSESTHECAACGTEYQGNYCPRCGQSASIGRFSFKKAMQHFLDVWGMGNRSMFRSLRDLVLRPGYMIRDYLSGMQSAYFPPFKMFFVFVAISLLVEHGVSFDVEEKRDRTFEPQTEVVQQNQQENNEHLLLSIIDRFTTMMDSLREKNPAIFSLFTLMLFSWPLFFFLHKTPKIPDLRVSEFIVVLVYTSNSYTIFSIAGDLLDSDLLRLIAVIMVFVALHQFSGYKKLRILAYIILTLIISITAFCIIISTGLGITYLFVSK